MHPPGRLHNPRLQDALDRNRFDALRVDALEGANLWLGLYVAACTRDPEHAAEACRAISAFTRATFALVKRLGDPDPADG